MKAPLCIRFIAVFLSLLTLGCISPWSFMTYLGYVTLNDDSKEQVGETCGFVLRERGIIVPLGWADLFSHLTEEEIETVLLPILSTRTDPLLLLSNKDILSCLAKFDVATRVGDYKQMFDLLVRRVPTFWWASCSHPNTYCNILTSCLCCHGCGCDTQSSRQAFDSFTPMQRSALDFNQVGTGSFNPYYIMKTVAQGVNHRGDGLDGVTTYIILFNNFYPEDARTLWKLFVWHRTPRATDDIQDPPGCCGKNRIQFQVTEQDLKDPSPYRNRVVTFKTARHFASLKGKISLKWNPDHVTRSKLILHGHDSFFNDTAQLMNLRDDQLESMMKLKDVVYHHTKVQVNTNDLSVV